MGGDAVHSTAGGTLEPTLGSRLPYPHRQHDVASSRLNHLAQHLLPAEPERKIERDSHRMLAVLQREVLGDSGESGEHPHDGIRGGRPVPWPARRTIHELPPPPKHGVRCCARTATRWLDRHNGKIERHQRLLADECLYARAYASENERRNAISVWNHHYNYHPPHTTRSDQPPASRLCTRVNNVMASYT